MSTKIAIDEGGKPLGFIHAVPIDIPSSYMIGKDLMVITCLTINYQLVYKQIHGSGVGRALVQSIEKEAKEKCFKGLAVYAYTDEYWFMPSVFFEKLNFKRTSNDSNIWVKKWAEVENPIKLNNKYKYTQSIGKVVIDYFWSPSCLTTCEEAANSREVTSEFANKVELNEYRTDIPEIFSRYGIARAIYINGKRKDWGYAAPKDELRKEIKKAIENISKN